MKKMHSVLSIFLSAALAVCTAAPMTVSAAPDGIVRKELKTYIFSNDKTGTISCVFSSSLPDVPYITAEDYLSTITDGSFTGSKNADGTFSVSNKNGKMIVNTANDTIHYDAIDKYFNTIQPVKEGTMLEAAYCKPIDTVKDEDVSLTLDLGAYGIDIIEADGKAYFPLTTLSDIYFDSYNAGEYCDGCIYFVHTSDELSGKSYVNRASVYESTARSPEMVTFTYNELCFVMDNFYGCPSKSAVASSMQQKGFDKTLDEYSDDTRRAKQLLLSSDKTDLVFAMCYLSGIFWDGGHTAFNVCLVDVEKNLSSPVALDVIQKARDPMNKDAAQLTLSATYSLNTLNDMNSLSSVRSAQYSKYQTVKTWDGDEKVSFLRSGDTGVFVFDSFVDTAVDAFKWSLDYAVDNGIKKFVVDVSCNGGGSQAVLCYMLGLMKNKELHTNIVSMSGLDTLTGEIDESKGYFDFNLDGNFDDADKDVSYDLEFAVLSSHNSFSCGNLLPVMAKDSGIPVFGERSGGGTCSVGLFYTAEQLPFAISSSSKFIDKNGDDVDSGAATDVNLTTVSYDGTGAVDYTGLYDIDRLGEMTESFYSSAWDPSQYEPSQSQPSQPQTSQPQTSQPQPSQPQPSQPAEASADSAGGVSGGIIAVWIIAALLPAAALVLCLVLNAKANKRIRKYDADSRY